MITKKPLDLKSQKAAVDAVEVAIKRSRYGDVCLEVAKFVESVASRVHIEERGAEARNAKAAIDYLIDSRLIDRPLGFKLHVVRELRNEKAHNPSCSIGKDDALLAGATLNAFLAWVNGANMAREWNVLAQRFESVERNLASRPTYESLKPAIDTHRILVEAVDLKLRSLGIQGERRGLFDGIELLAKNGLDVRSKTWRDLVTIRNNVGHGFPPEAEIASILAFVKQAIPELRGTLEALRPVVGRRAVQSRYPKVIFHEKVL